MNRDVNEFFGKILPTIDKLLRGKVYIINEEPSVIDILYYNEISTITKLTKRSLDNEKTPELFTWYNNMSRIRELEDSDKKLEAVIEKY